MAKRKRKPRKSVKAPSPKQELDRVLGTMEESVPPTLPDDLPEGYQPGHDDTPSRDFLTRVDDLRRAVARGDIYRVALLAMDVHFLWDELVHGTRRRLWEYMLADRDRMEAMHSEYAKEHGHLVEAKLKAVELYHQIRKAKPDLKKSAVEKRVQKETGVAPRTLRGYLKAPWVKSPYLLPN